MTTDAEVYDLAAKIRQALTHLGHCYQTQAGDTWEVSFRRLQRAGDRYVILELDTTRLPRRVSIPDLETEKVLSHLSAVVGRPVTRLNTVGLSYVVMLQPPPKPPPWPARVELPDLAPAGAGPWAWPFGVTRDGRHVWASLAKTSHLLIAGKSGAGKSTALNAGLLALLRAHDPAALRLVLIDGKGGVELWPFSEIPHLAQPVATDPDAGAQALGWLVGEVARREALFRADGVRTLTAYNHARQGEPLPLVLAMIDEITDLVGLWGGPRSDPFRDLIRLASKARAFGVILVMSTQAPRADVLDTLVRENAGARVAFKVDTNTQSRLILGQGGAEDLPPARPGRCVVVGLGERPMILQGYAVEDAQVTGLVVGLRASKPSPLSDLDLELVAYARDWLGGAFRLKALGEFGAGRISYRKLKDLARAWESRGWLTKPADAVSPRMMTPELLRLAGAAGGGLGGADVVLRSEGSNGV